MERLKRIGLDTDNNVYVVAEIGINHGGDIEVARHMIDSVVRSGADAVKFQTYVTEKRVPKNSPIFGILKKCELPFKAFGGLKKYAEDRNIDFFSTPFDEESVDCLESINCGIYKVASFDVVNHKLLRRVAIAGKTIIMSVGMSNLTEIEEALKILKSRSDKVAILHCVSAYPHKEEEANLAAIHILKDRFKCVVGQSDHTNDIRVSLYAVAAGARIIEKHYKIDEGMECVDSSVSITEVQMERLVSEIRRLEKMLGDEKVAMRQSEDECSVFRRYSE